MCKTPSVHHAWPYPLLGVGKAEADTCELMWMFLHVCLCGYADGHIAMPLPAVLTVLGWLLRMPPRLCSQLKEVHELWLAAYDCNCDGTRNCTSSRTHCWASRSCPCAGTQMSTLAHVCLPLRGQLITVSNGSPMLAGMLWHTQLSWAIFGAVPG